MTHRLSFVTDNPPAAPRRPGPNSLCLFTSSVARSGSDTKTHSFVGILRPLHASVSGIMRTFSRTPDTTVAPTVCTLSP